MPLTLLPRRRAFLATGAGVLVFRPALTWRKG